MTAQAVDTKATTSHRNVTLDALRGLIIVLMALDHANYFIAEQHPPGEHWGGPFPEYRGALGFLTRLVTHPVAPGFFFLMGIGMVLFAETRRVRGWSNSKLIRHFVLRGLVLVTLQFTLVNLAWGTAPGTFPTLYQGVLAALGGGMILGSLFLWMRPAILAVLAATFLVATELSHPDPAQWGEIFDQPLGLVFGYSGGSDFFWSNYPVLPWLELVLFGMAFGRWMRTNERRAFNGALAVGGLFLAGFVVLRAIDGFGNIRPQLGDDWISFFNVVKYPPAMTFTLITMGVNLVVLGLIGRRRAAQHHVLDALAVFGRVPLFFYVLHLYLYSAIGFLEPDGSGLIPMYVLWLVGLAVLYPPCVRYGRLKRRHSDSLLRFL